MSCRVPSFLTSSVAAAALCGAAFGMSAESAARVAAPAFNCLAAGELDIPDTEFTMVTEVPAGDFVPPAGQRVQGALPAFCRVAATLRPTPQSHINVEVWLPTAGWNGKYLGVGSGGFAGSISYAGLSGGLRRGYAVAHTDMGMAPGSAVGVEDKPERWADWGYRSTHLMTVLAKEVVRAVYGRGPRRSYFFGCSTGGGQGLHEAQKYPADYDGIVAGAPGHNRVGTHVSILWSFAATQRDADSYLPPEKLEVLSKAVLARCDKNDGAADGVIVRPDRCDFDPASLQCKGGDGPECLTAPQVTAVQKMYAGPVNTVTGERIFPGVAKGSELAWRRAPPSVDSAPPFEAIFKWVFGSQWNWRAFDFGHDVAKMESVLGPITNALDPDLSKFSGRGGKIIAYQGWNDITVAPGEAANYLASVEKAMPGRSADFYRLFYAPGVGHCRGGVGPNVFGQENPQGPSVRMPYDPSRDLLTALEQWVERGRAPDMIIASRFGGGMPAGVLERSMPLCAWPKYARYNGEGDVDQAASYTCVAD